jgi:hypothetical protein
VWSVVFYFSSVGVPPTMLVVIVVVVYLASSRLKGSSKVALL